MRRYEISNGEDTEHIQATDDTSALGEAIKILRRRIAPPRAGKAIAADIAGARYIEIADASHGVTIQQPSHINALLLEHLTAIDARVPSSGPEEGSTWMQDA